MILSPESPSWEGTVGWCQGRTTEPCETRGHAGGRTCEASSTQKLKKRSGRPADTPKEGGLVRVTSFSTLMEAPHINGLGLAWDSVPGLLGTLQVWGILRHASGLCHPCTADPDSLAINFGISFDLRGWRWVWFFPYRPTDDSESWQWVFSEYLSWFLTVYTPWPRNSTTRIFFFSCTHTNAQKSVQNTAALI